jgi:endo-1,4-beta-xylanase
MKHSHLLPCFAFLIAGCSAAIAATAPVFVPVLPSNTVKDGPPIPSSPAKESAHPSSIPLWPNGAPGSEARKDEPENISYRQEPDLVFPIVFNIHNPSITPFLPARDKATGCAVVIAPGGGHMFQTIDREGYDVARWLADRGIAAFVLKYRLARDAANMASGKPQPYKVTEEPRADALRAVRLIRSRAAEWGVDPARVGIMGFSAGGVPALAASIHADSGKPDAADPVERQSSRASFQALIYAELPRGDYEVPKDAPPAFMVVAFDDTPKATPLANYLIKLKSANVPAELHVYNRGGHGFGVRTDRPELPISRWPDRFQEWLGDIGMLKK